MGSATASETDVSIVPGWLCLEVDIIAKHARRFDAIKYNDPGSVVEVLAGQTQNESAPGKGSTFTLHLPRQ